ncbi:MAG: hypothetical protein JWM27_2872 [Gemmatimonadetes bacterium]|nr:hypothetical protein [Gemmatimonadota bacterium]
MLDTLTLETFQPLVGQPFVVFVGEDRFMPAHLVAVEALAEEGDTRRKRTPFSLLFRGPGGGYLPQDVYRVKGGELEEMELFLVPLGQDDDGTIYQAVFT